MDTLGVERIEAVADRGYFKIEDIEACERAGITAYVPRPIRGLAVNQGYFAKELFRYDPGEDVYVCPGDATLYPCYEGKVRNNRKVEYCNRAACKGCPLKPRCTGISIVGSRGWSAVLEPYAALNVADRKFAEKSSPINDECMPDLMPEAF